MSGLTPPLSVGGRILGAFVRPKLKVWAGRDDFDRAIFARQFRQVFTDEFDRMRDTIAQGGPKMGWLTMNFGFDGVTRFVSGLVANVVLLIATGAGRVLFGGVEMPFWLRGKSGETKIEDQVDDLKAKVDQALSQIDVGLHSELSHHARSSVVIEESEWPLPIYVKKHLRDRESGSWW